MKGVRSIARTLCVALFVLGGCGPSVETVQRMTDQRELAKIALEDKDGRVRRAAAEKLTDQALLARIAAEDKDWNVRRADVEKITDQALLAKIAGEEKDRDIRRAVAAKITDQGFLAKIALEDKDEQIRRAAVAKIPDPALLAKAALQDRNSNVRYAAASKLSDQGLLAKIALEDEEWNVRRAAVAKLADQALLAKIAARDTVGVVRSAAVAKITDPGLLTMVVLQAEDGRVCGGAVNKLFHIVEVSGQPFPEKMRMWIEPEMTRQVSDQGLLAKIATGGGNGDVRRAAVEKLNDPALLAQIAVQDQGGVIRRAAAAKLNDQALLAKIAAEDPAGDVRRAAVEKLADQALLAKIAMQDPDGIVCRAALDRIGDQALRAKIATESKRLDIRVAAIGKMTDQVRLRQWAEKDPQAAIRQAAVRRIADDGFLVRRLPQEPSAAVRAAAIDALRGKDALREVALRAYRREDREQALERAKKLLGGRAPDLVSAHKALANRVKALGAETDNRKLLALVLEGEFDVLRAAAVRRLSDPAALEQAALRGRDREALKLLLAKLADKGALNRIAAGADDRAVRLAAAQKAGAQSWREIFTAATAKGATPALLGDALAAVSLFPAVQPDAVDGVQQACLNLIRRGDESRIPEMADLLQGYGDKTLGEDYINCGQPDLNVAGRDWLHRHGYAIRPGPGSHRASWGSAR